MPLIPPTRRQRPRTGPRRLEAALASILVLAAPIARASSPDTSSTLGVPPVHPVPTTQPVRADPLPTPGPTAEPMFLMVSINGSPKGDLLVHRTASGDFMLRREDLDTLGLRLATPAATVIDGEPHVSLQAQGQDRLTFTFHASVLALEILADPGLLTRSVVDAGARATRAARLAQDSGFINWAIEQSLPGHQGTATGANDARLSLEAGARLGPLLLVAQGGTARDAQGRQRFVRLNTAATYDLPGRLQRWSLGDLVTNAPELGSSIALGGFALSKAYGLDPYQVRYPLGQVQGQATLPSEVDVYIDGQRIRSERVPPGAFEIRDLPDQRGARAVQLVVRDPYGRVQRFDYALYTSDQLLQRGLHEYQYAFGALRRGYGTSRASYGPGAFAGYHRYGFSDPLTLGLRAEGREGLLNIGTLGTMRLGAAGVLSWAWAASRASGVKGRAGLLQYAYEGKYWGLGASLRQESAGYAQLTDPLTLSGRDQGRLLYASRSWPGFGTVSVSHAAQTVHAPAAVPLPPAYLLAAPSPRRSTTLGYATYLTPWRSALRFSLSRVNDSRGGRTEARMSLSLVLDGSRLLTASAYLDRNGHTETIQWGKTSSAPEGWTYDLEAGHSKQGANAAWWRGSTQLNSRHVQLRADYRGDQNGDNGLRLGAAGSMAWVDGQVYFGRPVDGSFVVARTGELAGIPVTLNNVPMGVTEPGGRLFIPRVSPHYEAEIAIEAQALPIDHAVARLRRRIVLPERSGAVVDFEARRVQALVGRLVRQATTGAEPLSRAEVTLHSGPGAHRTTTGPEGELYLENLARGRHSGEASTGPDRCRFEVEVPASEDVIVEVGDILCEDMPPPSSAQNRSSGPR